jgi:N-acetylglutamate synthase-like GNAT family acetyltransferase
MDLTIRTARAEEREHLENLQRRASLIWDEYRDALLANPDAIVLPITQIVDGLVLVAESDGATIGFCVVLPREDGDAELDGLFVEPSAWRGGVGRLLVQKAAALARSMRAQHLHVIANPRATGFYAACGFETIGNAQTRFGSATTMRLVIASA